MSLQTLSLTIRPAGRLGWVLTVNGTPYAHGRGLAGVGLPALPLPAPPIVAAHGNGQKIRGLAQVHTQAIVCSDTPRIFTMASETASMASVSSDWVRA